MNTQRFDRKEVLDLYAALPEAYQPAWGLDETRGQARRACDDRLAALLAPLAVLPGDGPLRILDIGCAQGYFAFALQHELAQRGRTLEVVGVDYLEDNIAFCQALASYHGSPVRFLHDRFDDAFFARHSLADFDAILALNVLHHLHELDGEQAARAAIDAMREHGRVLFCELAQREEMLDWIGARADPDEHMLAGYAFRRRLGRFATHLTNVQRPLYACSASLAFVGDHWFAFEGTQERSHSGVPDAFSGQRRVFFGHDALVKCYRGQGEFGHFNRAELDAEAENLDKLEGEPDRYPRVLARADDGDAIWLARGLLPGRLLSSAIGAGEALDRDAIVRALLHELAHLETRGFWHADLRCWNVLLQDSDARLIDFGALTSVQSPLRRVALAAVLLEVARAEISYAQPFYAAIHPLASYPSDWRTLVCYLLETPQDEFSFGAAVTAFESPKQPEVREHALCPATDVLEAVANEQRVAFQRLAEHARETERLSANVTAHAQDLAGTLARQTREADIERGMANKALAHAAASGADLEQALARQTREANAERADANARIASATTYAGELEQRLEIQRRVAEEERAALGAELARADAHAHACEARLVAAHAGAQSSERALRSLQEHAHALQSALDESTRYVHSLQAAIEDKDAYGASLEAERERLSGTLERAEGRIAALQRRFRWLKPLWPR